MAGVNADIGGNSNKANAVTQPTLQLRATPEQARRLQVEVEVGE